MSRPSGQLAIEKVLLASESPSPAASVAEPASGWQVTAPFSATWRIDCPAAQPPETRDCSAVESRAASLTSAPVSESAAKSVPVSAFGVVSLATSAVRAWPSLMCFDLTEFGLGRPAA